MGEKCIQSSNQKIRQQQTTQDDLTRHRWEDNIKMHLKETGWECTD